MKKVTSVVLSTEEYERALKKLFGEDVKVEFSMDGIWVGYDDSEKWIDEEELHQKLAREYGFSYVTSVHMDDCDEIGVWVTGYPLNGGKELAKITADAINHFSFSEKEFCEEMRNEHRTLQQNLMRLALAYIEDMSKREYFDDRNEASVEAAKKIQNLIEEEHIYLPYI